MVLAAVAVLAVVALWWCTRTRELFVVSVRGGRVLVVHGRVPGTLLSQFRDILAKTPRGTVRVVRTESGARLAVSGAIDDGTAQRLRNVLGIYPLSKLRAAPVIQRPTAGQLLGIAWLAWLLDRSGR